MTFTQDVIVIYVPMLDNSRSQRLEVCRIGIGGGVKGEAKVQQFQCCK